MGSKPRHVSLSILLGFFSPQIELNSSSVSGYKANRLQLFSLIAEFRHTKACLVTYLEQRVFLGQTQKG